MKIVSFWLLLLGVLILLAGCEVNNGGIDKGEAIGTTGGNTLYRFYDREEGVVCYKLSRSISCLRMGSTR
ncbi:hypothetical protein [Pseudomonas phage K4]|nr:hypothetical protein [Pseudomonas phage K4]